MRYLVAVPQVANSKNPFSFSFIASCRPPGASLCCVQIISHCAHLTKFVLFFCCFIYADSILLSDDGSRPLAEIDKRSELTVPNLLFRTYCTFLAPSRQTPALAAALFFLPLESRQSSLFVVLFLRKKKNTSEYFLLSGLLG